MKISVISADREFPRWNFQILTLERKFMSGFPMRESTAAMSIEVRMELKYHTRKITMAQTAQMIIYLASLFIRQK